LSNILYTTGNYRNKLAELYKLWEGNDIRESNYIMLNDHYSVAVDKDTKEYVGVATLIIIFDQVHNRSWGLVENVFVHPKYRRQRIAEKLMHHVESIAIGMGCEFIKLTSRKKESQELYKFLGYEQGMSFRKELRKI
jgi:GNAT superfamily N-acetyltransferase